MGAIFGAGFGAVGMYAAAVESVAIYTALGFSSLTFAAISAIDAIKYGSKGNASLAFTSGFFALLGLGGAAGCFGQAFKIQSAKSTTSTVSNNSNGNTTKAETIRKNAQQGRDFEIQEFDKFKEKYNNAVEQITIKTSSGTRTRVDAIGLDSGGKVVIYEFKSSDTAPLTANQKTAFPEILESGGVVVGKGKGIFNGGYEIPKGTTVEVIRP